MTKKSPVKAGIIIKRMKEAEQLYTKIKREKEVIRAKRREFFLEQTFANPHAKQIELADTIEE